MPILKWIGKDAVVNHDKDVPFRLLKKNKSKSVDNSENLIIEGDNLEALKALLPYYQNKIKCVYVDPPYNTGKEKWRYNDNVTSPIIKKWLNEQEVVVEDLNRHDKWLCMMYPRLKMLRELLSEDGLVFVSIGDDEVQSLKIIMNDIFGSENFIAQFVWNTEGSTDNTLEVKIVHEYVLLFSKNISQKKNAFSSIIAPDIVSGKLFKDEIENTAVKNGKANPPSEVVLPKNFPAEIDNLVLPKDKIPKEFFEKIDELKYIPRELAQEFNIHYPIRNDPIIVKNFKLKSDCRVFSGWGNLNKLKQFIENDLKAVEDEDGNFSYFISKKGVVTYRKERKSAKNILSVIRNVGTTTTASNNLEDMGVDFDYPKPVDLISYIIRMSTRKDSVILDSFAGSGTTADAVLQLNKDDNGNRKFILVELESDICKNVTSQRVKKVIQGYISKKTQQSTTGTGGGFQYAVLDKKLFNSDGRINDSCTFEELASYIYFTETKEILDTKTNKTLIATHNDTDYYLIFNGIGKNMLDRKFLLTLNKNVNKVIYADKCTLDDSLLEKHNTIFKQIPYEVRVF